jgi:phycobilisome core-membrane linker protein
MTVTASSGSPRVSPQLFDTLPVASVRQAEQQDRFPDSVELATLVTFFRSGQDRIEAARIMAANAEAIVARAANRIFVGGTPLSFLESPLTTGEAIRATSATDATPLASDQAAFQDSIRTFTGDSDSTKSGNFFSRLLDVGGGDADVRVVLPTGFNAISVAKYGPAFMRKSVRDMGWFLRYVGYALVAGDPSILAVNTRGLRDILQANCSLAATNVALQEMRAASALLLKRQTRSAPIGDRLLQRVVEGTGSGHPQHPATPRQQSAAGFTAACHLCTGLRK